MNVEHTTKPVSNTSSTFFKRLSVKLGVQFVCWWYFSKWAKTETCGIRENICKLNCWEIQNIYSSPSRCLCTAFYLLKRHEPLAAENISTTFVIFVIFNSTLENRDQEDWIAQSWISHIYPKSFETELWVTV